MILTIDHNNIRELQLNRPPVNALSGELLTALRQAIKVAAHEGVQALILSGAPGRFSGGLDIPLLLSLDRAAIGILWRELYALLEALASSPIPIAAALTGHAPAGGAVLSLFCDWRVMASGDFKIGLNETQVGIVLPPVILGALRRQVGARRAEWLAVSGSLLSPQQALDIGLIDELAPPDQTVQRATEWCQRLLAVPSAAMLATRSEARADLIALFDRDLADETGKMVESWWSPQTQSTLRAVAEKLKTKKPGAHS